MAFTRIFFATDVYGSEKTYVKFLNAASFYKSQILILGGDITGKVIVPLVKDPNGYSGKFRGIDRLARNDSELETLEREIREAGYYPYRTEPGEMAELQADESRVQPIFKRLMLDMLKRWIQMAGGTPPQYGSEDLHDRRKRRHLGHQRCHRNVQRARGRNRR